MRTWAFILLFLFGCRPVPAATPLRPQYTVNTMAELGALDPRSVSSSNRVSVVVLGKNWPGDWGGGRHFFWDRTNAISVTVTNSAHYATNAAAIGRWVSTDRFAPIQNAKWWGAVGDSMSDDTVALNAAASYTATYVAESAYTTLNGQGGGMLVIPPTQYGYYVTNTIFLQSSFDATGAAIIARQPTNTWAVVVGPEDYENTFINNHRFSLPDIWGRDDGFWHNSTGVMIRSVGRSTVDVGYIYRFGLGLELRGDTQGSTLLTINDGFIDTCRRGVSLLATNGGFVNGNTWVGAKINLENPNFEPGTTNGYEAFTIDGTGGSINGNVWLGGSIEGFPGQRVIHVVDASANLWKGMRLEHHVSDYTNVVASALYMEVNATSDGKGLDNRFEDPSQGVNGMQGIQVWERGYAKGNSGGSSQWTEKRTRDNGYNHGPLVFTPSAGSSGQAMLTVYPEFTHPANHWANYTNWVMLMAANGWRVKNSADESFRFWLEQNGNMTWAAGGSTYQPIATIAGGTYLGYDDSVVQRIKLDRAGALSWYAPTTGTIAGTIRPYWGSTFGGFTIVDVPSNQLSGWTHVANLDSGTYAFPGQDLVAGSQVNKWVYQSSGIYGPSHPHGYIQNRSGVYLDASDSGAWGGSGYAIAMPRSWMDFQVRLGATTSPSLQIDQSTTAGQTRLLIWDAATAGPIRVMHHAASRLFHSGTNIHALLADLVGLSLSAGDLLYYNGTNLVRHAIGSAGQLLLATNSPARPAWVTPGTATWRDVPGSGNATTSQVVLGSDTRLSDARTPTSHTHPSTDISDSSAAGRALLTAANAAAQRSSLGLGTLALVNDAPSDTKTYGRKDGAWAEIVSSGGTYSNFWPDLTNALRAGANVTLTLDPTNRTATYAATASGSSNGTPVSIDGGSTLAALNIQSTATVEWSNAGTNGSASVKADSLGTNHLSAAAESYLLNRSNHTGTQLLSTISDAGALAAVNDAPTDGSTYGRKDGAWVVVTNSGSEGGTVTLSNLVQRVGWAEWETVLDWSSGTATGKVQNASQAGTISAVYTPAVSTNGVAGMPPFPDNPFGIRAMRVNLAGTGFTTNTVFVLKKLSLQTTNVASSSYTNSGWTSADYLLLQASLVSTNVPLIVDIDPGFSTIAAGSGLDLHTWTNRFRMDLFEVSNVSVAGATGPTVDSQSVSNIASSLTVSNEISGGVATPKVIGWTAPNKQIAAWTALDNAPGTNASTVAQFAIRGDGIPALVFTNNTAREANFMGWVPSGIDLTSGVNVTAAVYSEGNGGASNVVLQAEIMRLCCTGSGALDTNAFATSGAVTSALPTTVSVPTNLLVALPSLTNLSAGDLFRMRLSFVVGSASDTNDFNRGLIGARMEAR